MSESETILYECPRCYRIAPWTDGTDADDPEGEVFWCQTCGAETPLNLMAVVDDD